MRVRLIDRELPEEGYRSYLLLLLPIISKQRFDEAFLLGERGNGVCLTLMFNTFFSLTTSNKHVLIQLAILGFGFEFFIKTR